MRCRRRCCAPGAVTSASRAAPPCARGSTGSRPMSASTWWKAATAGLVRWIWGRRGVRASDPVPPMDDARKQLLARYVQAFERYDLDALTSLIQEDARQSMPPYDLWLRGRDDILAWWFGPGIGCRGSRLLPTMRANGCVAFGQYKPSQSGSGRDPWSLLVVETEGDRIREFTFFLDTARLFPLFGLPPHVD